MRDHRPDHDPTPVDITELVRRNVGRHGTSVRVTAPDWRIGRPPRPRASAVKKARRQQVAASRKANRK